MKDSNERFYEAVSRLNSIKEILKKSEENFMRYRKSDILLKELENITKYLEILITTKTIRLPTEILPERKPYLELGFQIDEEKKQMIIPEHWYIEPEENVMFGKFFHLIDEKGRTRGEVKYTSANSHIILYRRFELEAAEWMDDFDDDWHPTYLIDNDTTNGEPIRTRVDFVYEGIGYTPSGEQIEYLLHQYLNKNYPDWENPAACWR